MANRINIEEATPNDAEALGALHFRSHTVSFREFFRDDPDELRWLDSVTEDEYVREWTASFAAQPREEKTWVARLDGTVVGFVSILPVQPREEYPAVAGLPLRRCVRLRAIHVEPTLRGDGCGLQLMKRAMRHLESLPVYDVLLDTHDANAPARRFYEKHGFQIAGRFRRGDGWPLEVVYRLRLPPLGERAT